MADATITTPQRNYSLLASASTPTSFAALSITSRPSTGVVWDYQTTGANASPSLIRLMPWCGTAAAGASGSMRVVGWSRISASEGDRWLPSILGEFTLTFSTTLGNIPSWTLDTNTVRPYQLVSQAANAPAAYLYSPGSTNTAASEPCEILLDCKGAQVVTVQFAITASPSATMGVLYTTL
jgi:hypothetical protein